MSEPTAYEKERLVFINETMNEIYDKSADIYEGLVDRDFESLRKSLPELINTLKDIEDSIREDV